MPERNDLAKKACRKFIGNLAFTNFGVRSVGLRVAARKTGCTSEILASRATPAYIYTRRVGRFWKAEIFWGIIDFQNKIIPENRKLLFRLRKILEKFLGIDGRIRNTTKVVLAPEKDFWIDRGKRQTSNK